MTPNRRSGRGDAGATARRVRFIARIVLLGAVFVAVFAPIAWERLPDFKAVTVPNPPRGPAPKPGPGIDPRAAPPGPTIIRPSGPIPPHGTGAYGYFSFFEGRPPYVSTCEPVPFVIRTQAAPADGARLVFDGLQQVADATGLSFEFKGYTDEIYQFNQRKTRYAWENNRQALWMGWATDAEVPDLGPKPTEGGYAVGVGGPVTFDRPDGAQEIVGGGVVLRSGELYPIRLGAGETSGNILLHELGHSFGLDHVDSDAELMSPTLGPGSPNGFAGGDRTGLEGLQEGCG